MIDARYGVPVLGGGADPSSGATINVIDAATEQPAWAVKMDLGIRPMTFNSNPDGSTKWIFAQLTGYNGFAVVDFATRKEIKRIQNPDLPPGKMTVPEGSDPSHGMAVTADGTSSSASTNTNGSQGGSKPPTMMVSPWWGRK